jgi:predicted Zn-dependent peptidase
VPQTLVEERDSNQSHLRISYRPQVDPRDLEQRAALAIYSTLLGGSMGSRLFDEIREQRGLAYSVYSVEHSFADVPILQLSAGLESGKCREAYQCMRGIVDDLRENGPRDGGVRARPRLRGGRRVLAFENTNAVAATRPARP